MDLSQLSDEELEALASGGAAQAATPKTPDVLDMSSMSDDELARLASGDFEPSFMESLGQDVLGGLLWAGEKVDSVTGAPTRAALGAIQDGRGLTGAASAFGDQFAEDPNLAPTGKEVMARQGLSTAPLSATTRGMYQTAEQRKQELADKQKRGLVGRELGFTKLKAGGLMDPSPAGVAGLALDIAADPTNLIPGTAIARGALRGAKAGGRAAGKAAASAADKTLDAAKALPGAKTVEATANVIREGSKNTAEALRKMFTPAVADDADELFQIAQKHGIDPQILPEAIEFGENSFISRAARSNAEGVLGEPRLKKFESALESVQDATERQIQKISGGSVPSAVEAGEILRKGYDDAVEELFNSVDFTYKEVTNQAPGIRLTEDSARLLSAKMSGIEKYAKGLLQRGITNTEKGQAKQLLAATRAIRSGNGSLKQLHEAMEQLGRHAFKSQNALSDVPVDKKKMQDLYFAARDAFVNSTASQLGDDVAQRLIDSNQLISNFNADKEFLASVLGNKNLSPERVFKALVQQGDTNKIKALKNVLPPEKLQQIKGAFLESLIKRNADEQFTFKSLHNSLRSKKNILGELFSPEELDSINEVIRLGSRFGNPILSTSGTGASNLFRNVTEGIRSGLESDTIIDALKNSARKRKAGELTGKAVGSADQAAIPAGRVAKPAVKDVQKGTLYPKRGRIDAAAKGGQVGAASNQNNKEDRKVLNKLRGKDKWANDGFNKVIKNASAEDIERYKKMRDKLLSSNKGKDLLSQLSSLQPGSKAYENTLKKLENLEGEN